MPVCTNVSSAGEIPFVHSLIRTDYHPFQNNILIKGKTKTGENGDKSNQVSKSHIW